MFNGKERQKIAELETKLAAEIEAGDNLASAAAKLQGQKDRHIQELEGGLVDLNAQIHDAAMRQSDMANEIASLQARLNEKDNTIREQEIRIAQLEGAVSVNSDKAAKWDRLALGWTWHGDGSVELDGKKYSVVVARADNPLANFRMPIPEGQEFP